MPLSLEPLPIGPGTKEIVKVMENYPIMSSQRHTDQQFATLTDELRCEELVQQFDDICSCITIEENADIPTHSVNDFTFQNLSKQQFQQFQKLIRRCKLKAASNSQNSHSAQIGLVMLFGKLVQDLIDTAQKNIDLITAHFARQKHDLLFSYKLDMQRIDWEIENLDKTLRAMSERETSGRSDQDIAKKNRLAGLLQEISELAQECKNHANLLDLQQKICIIQTCPVCQKQLGPSNLLLVVSPCGCGICQRCFKGHSAPGKCLDCPGCGATIDDKVIDGAIAQRLQEPRLDFQNVCSGISDQMTQVRSACVQALAKLQ